MRWLIDIVYLLAGLLYLPIAFYNALVLGKNRRGWPARFGFTPTFKPGRQRIWIHAVSLGEINCTPRLVQTLRDRLPGTDIVVSTTTDTGYARAVQHFGSDCVFRFPLDLSLAMSRALRHIRPTIIVLVELELWPNLMNLAHRRHIPVAIVNGRLTERSARRLSMLGALSRQMFAKVAWVGAQDAAIASRFRRLGVPQDRVEITSSLKWDSAIIADEVDGATELARALGLANEYPLWVCGSTGPGEEPALLAAYKRLVEEWPRTADEGSSVSADSLPPVPALAIVPRKPERFDEVARLIESAGFECRRRSAYPDGAAPPAWQPPTTVVLGDTMGELRKFYSRARLAFVGRSLVPMGGSDPIEAAALSVPILAGPHMSNFRQPVSALSGAKALRTVQDEKELASLAREILVDLASARAMGSNGRAVVKCEQGATRRTVDKLVSLIAKLTSHHQ